MQKYRQTDRQTDIQKDRQTDIHTYRDRGGYYMKGCIQFVIGQPGRKDTFSLG